MKARSIVTGVRVPVAAGLQVGGATCARQLLAGMSSLLRARRIGPVEGATAYELRTAPTVNGVPGTWTSN